MGKVIDCGVAGYGSNSTCIRLDPSETPGPYWQRVLPWCRGKRLVLDLSLFEERRHNLVQDIQVMASMLQRKRMQIVLSKVPTGLVRQLGKLKISLQDVYCMDIFAPYYCPVCEREVSVLLPLSPDAVKVIKLQKNRPSPVACDSCHSEMHFNDDPKSFFSFLDRLQVFDSAEIPDVDLDEAILDAQGTKTRNSGNISQNLARHVWWLGLGENTPGAQGGKKSSNKDKTLETAVALSLMVVNVGLLIWLIARIA